MQPYYQDDHVTLYHGDSLEILPALDLTADVLLTDPPYFKVKQDEWDNQWDKAGEFLGWMGEWLDHTKPLLAPHASVWVFASPAMTSSVERLVGERFRVLNSIRWVKPQDRSSYTPLPSLRRFLTQWEGIVFAEHPDETYGGTDYWARKSAFKDAGEYLRRCRVAVGVDRADVAQVLTEQGVYSSLGSARSNVSMQEDGQKMVSAKAYEGWAKLVPLKPYAELAIDYAKARSAHEDARNDYEGSRRPFNITERGAETDMWTFPNVKHYKGKHPCEKPQDMLTHMIRVSSRPGQLILDPFAGSGSTLLAARNEGRRAVGIEKDEAWCEKIAARLSEQKDPDLLDHLDAA